MRKSTFYFRGAYVVWAMVIVWSVISIIFYNRFAALRNALGFLYPFIGFAICWIGINVAKKGAKLKYIEEGRLAEYQSAITKRPKVWPYMATIYLVIAVILVIINLAKG